MTRALIFGNGNILVCKDVYNRVRDFYYPYVGQENHVSGNKHKTGIFVDKTFSWTDTEEWKRDLKYKKETLVGETKAVNEKLLIELNTREAVCFNKNVFLREVIIKNKSSKEREIKVFFHQHFHISESNIGDTVYYDPLIKAIINYKEKRYFLISGSNGKKVFDSYATGVADAEGKQGTYIDAEDGELSKNPVEYGSVDSAISFKLKISPNSSKTIYYWVAVGENFKEVKELNNFVIKKGPKKIISETEDYWKRWVNKQDFYFCGLNENIVDLFKKSLLIVKAQTDKQGAIIAANDSHTLYFKKDTYSYMWPRDGALIARSLDKVGHIGMTKRFFEFCNRVISDEGYLMHKYRPDGSLGSSWHSWLKGDKIQLPIQEDETALLLDALWKWFIRYDDRKFAKEMYLSFIKKAGDFLVKFRDKKTKLPKESYDLWEEKLGIHTFTCCTVYAGLEAAKNFAKVLGKKSDFKKYEKASKEIKLSIIKYLYDNETKSFIKRVYYDENGKMHKDKTIDSSTGYALFEYKVLDVNDPKVKSTMDLIKKKLECKTNIGGIARYENDKYHKKINEVPGNPWFICTLWLAEYYIAKAKSKDDLKHAEEILNWTTEKAMSTGVLSEQIHPQTGETLSVAPLTWSHAGFIIAVVKYLDKLEELGVCEPYKNSFLKKNKKIE